MFNGLIGILAAPRDPAVFLDGIPWQESSLDWVCLLNLMVGQATHESFGVEVGAGGDNRNGPVASSTISIPGGDYIPLVHAA